MAKEIKTKTVKNVKQLKDFIATLPDDLPVGTWYPNYWNHDFKKSAEICLTDEGLALNVSGYSNY